MYSGSRRRVDWIVSGQVHQYERESGGGRRSATPGSNNTWARSASQSNSRVSSSAASTSFGGRSSGNSSQTRRSRPRTAGSARKGSKGTPSTSRTRQSERSTASKTPHRRLRDRGPAPSPEVGVRVYEDFRFNEDDIRLYKSPLRTGQSKLQSRSNPFIHALPPQHFPKNASSAPDHSSPIQFGHGSSTMQSGEALLAVQKHQSIPSREPAYKSNSKSSNPSGKRLDVMEAVSSTHYSGMEQNDVQEEELVFADHETGVEAPANTPVSKFWKDSNSGLSNRLDTAGESGIRSSLVVSQPSVNVNDTDASVPSPAAISVRSADSRSPGMMVVDLSSDIPARRRPRTPSQRSIQGLDNSSLALSTSCGTPKGAAGDGSSSSPISSPVPFNDSKSNSNTITVSMDQQSQEESAAHFVDRMFHRRREQWADPSRNGQMDSQNPGSRADVLPFIDFIDGVPSIVHKGQPDGGGRAHQSLSPATNNGYQPASQVSAISENIPDDTSYPQQQHRHVHFPFREISSALRDLSTLSAIDKGLDDRTLFNQNFEKLATAPTSALRSHRSLAALSDKIDGRNESGALGAIDQSSINEGVDGDALVTGGDLHTTIGSCVQRRNSRSSSVSGRSSSELPRSPSRLLAVSSAVSGKRNSTGFVDAYVADVDEHEMSSSFQSWNRSNRSDVRPHGQGRARPQSAHVSSSTTKVDRRFQSARPRPQSASASRSRQAESNLAMQAPVPSLDLGWRSMPTLETGSKGKSAANLSRGAISALSTSRALKKPVLSYSQALDTVVSDMVCNGLVNT